MKLIPILIPALLTALTALTALSAQAAQLYQWKDPQGRVFYSDQQPPPTVKNATQKNFKGSFIEGGESYAMKRAREKSPVSLYVTSCGIPCDQAKQHLAQRGIPHASKNPSASEPDRAALQKLTGRTHVPVLLIGDAKIEGYEPGQWDAALDKAGYPKAGSETKKPTPAESDKDGSQKPNTETKKPGPDQGVTPSKPPL